MDEIILAYARHLKREFQKIDKGVSVEPVGNRLDFESKKFTLDIELHLRVKEIEIINIDVEEKRQRVGEKIIDIIKDFGVKFKFRQIISTEVKSTDEAQEFWESQDFVSVLGMTYVFRLR